jgi:hypothetical protein
MGRGWYACSATNGATVSRTLWALAVALGGRPTPGWSAKARAFALLL